MSGRDEIDFFQWIRVPDSHMTKTMKGGFRDIKKPSLFIEGVDRIEGVKPNGVPGTVYGSLAIDWLDGNECAGHPTSGERVVGRES